MTCDDGRLLAFVSGQLSDADEQAFDEHLLTCEACWQAVREDRVGRLALERLREPVPPGVADRVTMAIRLASEPAGQPGHRARRHRIDSRLDHRLAPRGAQRVSRGAFRLVAACLVVVAIVGGVLGWALQGGPAADPPQIARIAAMMSPGVARNAALRDGERLRVGGQLLTVRSYRVDGGVVLVATSAQPFPMPSDAHLLAGSSRTAWMATRGTLAMYGVNRPEGEASMVLVAAMPMAELPQVAARLHLI